MVPRREGSADLAPVEITALHTLPLKAKRALAAVSVTLRFTCGTRVEHDDDPSRIWIRKTT